MTKLFQSAFVPLVFLAAFWVFLTVQGRRKARVSDTAGVRHDSLPADTPVEADPVSQDTKDFAKGMGLGG